MSTQQLKRDPSMDEILASIREIISEDVKSISTTKPVSSPRRIVRSPISAKQDILELTDAVDDELSRKAIIYNNQKRRGDFMAYSTEPKQDEALELSNEISENEEVDPGNEKRAVQASSKKTLNKDNDTTESGNSAISEKIRQSLSERDMISAEVLAKSSEALNALNDLNTGQDFATPSPKIEGSQTIEELMSSLLRPMLKNWLDANLPSIVKVIVTEQVEKVMKQRLK